MTNFLSSIHFPFFPAWCAESLGETVDLKTVSIPELDQQLRKFYAEAAPKNPASRSEKMQPQHSSEYHKNSFKNVRAAINRHLKDLGRKIDIVRDKEFNASNGMLNAKLKLNLKEGLSRPTQHYPVIPPQELSKLNEYLNAENPIALRYRIWYLLAIHFVSRGVEFHQQLSMSSLVFCTDESGCEYISLAHETRQKNYQGDINQKGEESQDKRMYATGGQNCPVESVKLFLRKTDPSATSLFNHCNREALKDPLSDSLWYNATPVKPKQFSGFMPDICKNAGVPRYTGHSLRATSIQSLSDAGFEARNIMFMSDHKREDSLKSYSRRPSTMQKQIMSSVLESVASGQDTTAMAVTLPPKTPAQMTESMSSVGHEATSGSNALVPHPLTETEVSGPGPLALSTTQFSQSHRLAGFAPSSTFSECTFNISFQQ